MFQGKYITRHKIAYFICFIGFFLTLVGCSPTRGHTKALNFELSPTPGFNTEKERFTSFDGAELGLTVWEAQNTTNPEYIVIGVHGMNDYAEAFEFAGRYWAARGVTTYAYDQRGFGRSHARGLWPKEELIREDLRTAITLARKRHPNAVLSVVGISMGAAVVMTVLGSDNPPTNVDRTILSGPGLRGWGALPWFHSVSLRALSSISPNLIVAPPKFVVRKITPSDNSDMLTRLALDELTQRNNRIDQVYGVVSVMENGHKAASRLPNNTLMLYGARDDVIPENFMRRTAPTLATHVRTAYYENGYHMLMRDLQHETVLEDQLSFMRDPDAALPSGAPSIPWAPGQQVE